MTHLSFRNPMPSQTPPPPTSSADLPAPLPLPTLSPPPITLLIPPSVPLQVPSGATVLLNAPTPPRHGKSIDPTTPPATRRSAHGGRRSRLSKADDLILVREVAAAKAHIAPNGETKERFEVAALKTNATGRVAIVVTWKSVQDRYKRLQDLFDSYDGMESRMSGVGGQVGDMDELLEVMKEARDDLVQSMNTKKRKLAEEEDKKERLGAFIRSRATRRKVPVGEGNGSADREGSSADLCSARKSERGSGGAVEVVDEEVIRFTQALESGDHRRNELNAQHLALERERFEEEKKERAMEREEQSKARAEAICLELQKFKLMMDLLRDRDAVSGPSKEHG